MRDFFIEWFEKLVTVIVVIICVGVLIGSLATMASEGLIAGLLVLIGGAVYAVMMGGMLYLVLGVYHNTRRTAEAIEMLAAKE